MNGSGPDRQDNKPTPPQLPSRYSRSMMSWVILVALALLAVTILSRSLNRGREITTSQFWNYVENGHLTGEVLIKPDRIEGQLADETPGLQTDQTKKFYVVYEYKSQDDFDPRLRAALAKHGDRAQAVYRHQGWWTTLLPHLVMMAVVLLVLWFFLFRRLGAGAGGAGFLGSFGRSRHRLVSKEQSSVTFADVAGIEEAKQEVAEIIEFLRDPKKFRRLGGRIPRGMLLVGEPGCGKTLLAKAIAGEAEVPFFSISGSDFVEMFVGVGASRVRDLFKQAKESSPCIVFLDEIDAVGRKRGVGFNGGGHDEREQTLNAILVEMDGFESSDQVIVIAATNRMDVLDPALTRPGRFDRQIAVPLPDLMGRVEILRIYAAKVKCGPDVDLKRLARGTPMFSGADLEALVNEAAIGATMANKEFVEQADLEEARDKVRWGRARRSRSVDEREKEMTAYHEAGHAIVQVLLPEADPLHKVSIIPRGQAGGATFSLPEKDRHLYSRKWCEAYIRVCIAGRIAEDMFCGDVDSGAASDIAQATQLARTMVKDWGMSDKLGFVRYAGDASQGTLAEIAGKEYSDRTAELIDTEVKEIMDQAHKDIENLLKDHRQKVESIAHALLKYETLDAEEVEQLIAGKTLDKPTVDDLLEAEQAKTTKSSPVPKAKNMPVPEPPTETLPEPG